ncbi:MAG TPA: putative lipid II flippase FtsW, partial [Aeromicrobium sp.]|nr:putative lipid II flippase FtsW [Aeromicrobium sp.]
DSHDMFGVFKKQFVFALLGLAGGFMAARLPLTVLRRLITPALVIIVALIIATYTPMGMEINGNRNWLHLGPGLQVQPSEFAKLAVVLWTANLYARRPPVGPKQMILPMVPVTLAVAGLVVFQDDLGTALVILAVIVGMLWVAGLPGRYMGVVLAGLGVVCIYFVATAPHRVARLLNYLNPSSDPDNTGYQAIHAFMGFARGGFWGVGLGGSRQKWGSLPEAHTDFILAIIGEELGLFGSLVVLMLFALFAVAGIRVAMRTKDAFVRYAAAGIVIWILSQAMINMGMVLGLLPVIGIPLPLISAGGSSLFATLVACGILLNCATTEPGARAALDASRARRRRRAAARKR